MKSLGEERKDLPSVPQKAGDCSPALQTRSRGSPSPSLPERSPSSQSLSGSPARHSLPAPSTLASPSTRPPTPPEPHSLRAGSSPGSLAPVHAWWVALSQQHKVREPHAVSHGRPHSRTLTVTVMVTDVRTVTHRGTHTVTSFHTRRHGLPRSQAPSYARSSPAGLPGRTPAPGVLTASSPRVGTSLRTGGSREPSAPRAGAGPRCRPDGQAHKGAEALGRAAEPAAGATGKWSPGRARRRASWDCPPWGPAGGSCSCPRVVLRVLQTPGLRTQTQGWLSPA